MRDLLSAIESLWDMFDPLSATYGATLLAFIVGAVHLLFRRWLTAGQLAVLWGLVLVRLLIPVAPQNPWSLQSLVAAAGGAGEPASETPRSSSAIKTAGIASAPASMSNPSSADFLEEQQIATQPATSMVDPEVVLRWTLATWFLVGFGGLAVTLSSHWRFGRRIRPLARCEDSRVTELWAQCRADAGFAGHCHLAVFDGVETPAVTGLIRPIVILPPGAFELADDQLRMVLLHELAHLQRRDIAANWVLALIRAIHWWNPIYWLAARRFRMLCEQACDERVLGRMGPHLVERYGELLLEFAKTQTTGWWSIKMSAAPLGIAIATFRVREIRARLRALRHAGTARNRWQRRAALVFILLLAICGLTDAGVQERPQNVGSWMAQPVVSVASLRSYVRQPSDSGPREHRQYEIGPALRQMPQSTPYELQNRAMFELLVKQLFPGPAVTYSVQGTTLFVDAPAGLHERLDRTLKAWSEGGMSQFVVRSRIITTKCDLLSELGIEWQFMEAFSSVASDEFPRPRSSDIPVVQVESRTDIYRPAVVATLNAEQAAAMIDEAQRNRRMNILQAPSITIFNGQEATLVDCVERPFVVGVRQRVGTLASANEPKIVVIEEGTKIGIRGTQIRGKESIQLEQRFEMTSVGKVTTAEASLRGERVTIEIPHVDRCVLNVASEIADGETLLVGCLPTEDRQEYLYFLLTAEILEEQPVTK